MPQPVTQNPQRWQRKGEHSSQVLTSTQCCAPSNLVDNRYQQICENSACRAVIKAGDTFCKRCSCCLCHQFDDNKDPSLWIACSDESHNGQIPCGFSCHLECALRCGIAGVVNIAGEIWLDASYCCSSCRKMTSLLGSWRKQLLVAKDARRVDVLCQRLSLAQRLLDGTSRYREQHKIVDRAAKKLEGEIGRLAEAASKCVRGIVSRLSCGLDVQQLVREALEAADLLQAPSENSNVISQDAPMVSAGVHFKDVLATSVVVCWKGRDVQSTPYIQGYQLWHHKVSELGYLERPTCTLPRTQRRALVSNLEPSTDYIFKVIAFDVNGEIERFEARCLTRPLEIPFETHLEVEREARFLGTPENVAGGQQGNLPRLLTGNVCVKQEVSDSIHKSFKVHDLGKGVCGAWARKGDSISRKNEGSASRTLVQPEVRPDSRASQADAGVSQANGNRAGTKTPVEANPTSTKDLNQRHGNGAVDGASDLSLCYHFHGNQRLEQNKHLISLVMEDRAELQAGAHPSLRAEVAPMPVMEWDSSSYVVGAQPVEVASAEGNRFPGKNMTPIQGMKRLGVEVALRNVCQQDSQRTGQPTTAENVDGGQGSKGADGNPHIGLKGGIKDFEKLLPAGRVNNCGDSSGSTCVLGKKIVPFGCFGADSEIAAGLQLLHNKVEICNSKAASGGNGNVCTAVDCIHVRREVQMVAAKQDESDGQVEASFLHSTLVETKEEKSGELKIAVPESQLLRAPLNGSERVFKQCVQTIRWLEREGHAKEEFRRNFFTWLSLHATEAEQKLVYIVMQNMLDDPVALAAQLLDILEEINAPKRLKVQH